MNLQQVIDQIAEKIGIDGNAAERAVGTLLSVIQQQLEPETSASLFSKLSGAEDLAAANLVEASDGGLLGSIAGTLLGAKAGIMAAGFSQLQEVGLSLDQIKDAGMDMFAYIKSGAGADIAKQVAASVPGLGWIDD
jgi:hypothetical protein